MPWLCNNKNSNISTAADWQIINQSGLTDISNSTTSIASTTLSATFGVNGASFTPGAITIDAIVAKIRNLGSSPSGVISARLFNVTGSSIVAGTTVSVNQSNLTQLNASGGSWIVFKFSAPVTLSAATVYAIQLAGDSSPIAYLSSSSGTLYSAAVRETGTQAPTVGDQIIVAGEFTNLNTLTNYNCLLNANADIGPTTGTSILRTAIEIGYGGTLTAPSTASVNRTLTLRGSLFVLSNGTFVAGTGADPIPASSTFTLAFSTPPANVDWGISIPGNGSFTTFGATKTTKAYLNASVNAAATSLTTDVVTGWASGDVIAIAATNRPLSNINNETQELTISSISGTTVNFSPSLSTAKNGGSVYGQVRAEIINITRNVVITGASTTLQSFIYTGGVGQVSLNYTSIRRMGSASSNKRGIDAVNVAANGPINLQIVGCAITNFEVSSSIGLNITASGSPNGTLLIQNNVFYRITSSYITTTNNDVAGNYVFDDNWCLTSNASASAIPGVNMSLRGISFRNFNIVSSGTLLINLGSATVKSTVNNIIAHSGRSGNGLSILETFSQQRAVVNNVYCYRNIGQGVVFNAGNTGIIDGGAIYENANGGMNLVGINTIVRNIDFYGSATNSQAVGIFLPAGTAQNQNPIVENCRLGTLGAHSQADISPSGIQTTNVIFRNCLFSSPSEVVQLPGFQAIVSSARHNQVNGSNKAWTRTGILQSDFLYFVQASPSLRMTPSSASEKLESSPRTIAVPSGRSIRVSCFIRKSVAGDGTAYNGLQPRLVSLTDPSIGITGSIIATATAASNGAFERITGTVGPVSENGVVKLIIDCDGTAGWVNVDLWTVEII